MATTMEVHIGVCKELFIIHKKVVCKGEIASNDLSVPPLSSRHSGTRSLPKRLLVSPWFRKAVKEMNEEGIKDAVARPTIRPIVFNAFMQRLYSNQVIVLARMSGENL